MSLILLDENAAAPAAPAAGKSVIYPKADGLWYSKDDAGVETLMSSGVGGGGSSLTEQDTAVTGTQHNFNLTQNRTLLRCTGAAPEFTGFTVNGAAPAEGDEVFILCLGTTAKVTHQDAGSTAAHRVICPSLRGQIVGLNGLMYCVYDSVTGRWREQVIDAGLWIVPTFNAGDFTASSGTWTVEAADVSNFSYQQRGNTLTVTLYADTTSVSAAMSQLRVTIPGGFAGAKVSLNQVLYYSDAGSAGVGFVDVADGGTTLRLLKTAAANWSISVNATSVYTTVTIEID